jgi:hypothetical protein
VPSLVLITSTLNFNHNLSNISEFGDLDLSDEAADITLQPSSLCSLSGIEEALFSASSMPALSQPFSMPFSFQCLRFLSAFLQCLQCQR